MSLEDDLRRFRERLIASQSPVEPEFFRALYENRHELYTLFEDDPTHRDTEVEG